MEEFYLENDHNLMAVALFAVRGYGVPNLTTGICICLLSLHNNSYNLREAGIQGSKFKDCLYVTVNALKPLLCVNFSMCVGDSIVSN